MNSTKVRQIATVVGVIILAAVGIFFWQERAGQDKPGRVLTYQVDRGLETADRERLLSDIENKKKQIAESPQLNISLILELGNLYYGLGDLAAAVREYQDILATNPTDAAALENSGQAYMEIGDYEAAETAWRQALLSNPYELTYLRLAELLTDKMPEKQAEALPVLEQGIASLGQQFSLMLALADWYKDNGRLQEALSHYEIVLKLDPKNKEVARTIEELRLHLTEEMRAVNQAE
jgi:tetratricopeptide (TPR) repeat protein